MIPHTVSSVTRTYVAITFFNTLAASFIWGINTLFLLDAGLSNFEAFMANAFFSAGMVLFEVPTGVFADTVGRKASYLLGCATLFLTTSLYLLLWLIKGPFYLWCVVSIFLGLGFTFFSGAVEAWLVDSLHHVGFKGNLEDVFAKGQIADGIAMLSGTVSGGYIAQFSNLGVPYIFRIGALLIAFVIGFLCMKDLGFSPRKFEHMGFEMKRIFRASIENGIKVRSVRWIMLTSPFLMGVTFYGFYAAQPYLLELYGNPKAYGIAGLSAALVAGSQIVGGFAVPLLRRFFSKRTHMMLLCVVGGAISLFGLGLWRNFPVAIILLTLWALLLTAFEPIKLAYLNSCVSSEQRATIISFDGMLGSIGGTIFQPAFGRAADIYSYGFTYFLCAIVQIGAIPFILLAGKENPKADKI